MLNTDSCTGSNYQYIQSEVDSCVHFKKIRRGFKELDRTHIPGPAFENESSPNKNLSREISERETQRDNKERETREIEGVN